MRSEKRKKSKTEKISTGSPQEGEPLYLVIGRFRKPHGLDGEILFDIFTDFPERIVKGKQVYIGEAYQPEYISDVRNHQKGFLIRLAGKERIEDVENLRNEYVYVRTDELPALPDGEYYFHQLVGMTVINEQGQHLGQVQEILETGANDVYLIRTEEGKELLLPAIDEIIQEIRIDEHMMIVRPPEWYS